MNTITLDIGNSNVKNEVWNEEGLILQHVTKDIEPETISDLKKRFNVDYAVVSSVRHKNLEEIAGLKNIFEDRWLAFDTNEISKYSSRIDYKLPVGADRIAAFLGAEKLFPSVPKLILDLGTAITADIADSMGVYQGGNISLGLQGRLNALSANTSLLPQINAVVAAGAFGKDTKEAILNGTVNGIAGELFYDITLAQAEYKIEKVVVTGGDAIFFNPFLERREINYTYDPSLVGRGLDFHLRQYLSGF